MKELMIINELSFLRGGSHYCVIEYHFDGRWMIPYASGTSNISFSIFEDIHEETLEDLWILEFSYVMASHRQPNRLI